MVDTQTPVREDTVNSLPPAMEHAPVKDIVAYFFADGNVLETTAGGVVEQSTDLQNIVAYFKDGTLIISKTHRFDGRILNFQALLEKKSLHVKTPFYGDLGLISEIYKADAEHKKIFVKSASDFDNQMQKDFVDIVSQASALHVSDVHVVVADQTSIYFRLDGDMQIVKQYNGNWGESFVRSVFASADLSDANYAQNDYQAAQKLGATPLRGSKDLFLPSSISALRLQFNPVAFASKYLVIRLLYLETGEGTKDLDSLGFTPYETRILYRMRRFPNGLCIIGGPTGSGKSTTLSTNMAMMLQESNFTMNLITVEDPVEVPIVGAHQFPVLDAMTEDEKDQQFTAALGAALRSDPDSMMIGEVRTFAAAELAIKGALSGHNVWTTLHANSALAVLTRLLDMKIDAYKLRDETLIRGLMSQRLYKRLCPKCHEPLASHPEHEAYDRVKQALGDIGLQQTSIVGKGCPVCNYKGTKGRISSAEMVIPDARLLELIVENKMTDAHHYWLEVLNGRTLKEAAISMMFQSIVGIEEVERWCGLLDEGAII